MAFEKAKVLKAAEKFLSQGNITAAIKEYRQIVEHDEDDLTALNMLGDLCARAGKKDEAISCFARIAEHYREQEFTLKAIAMYKKIDRLNPRDPVIAENLANLYANQGLVVDARAQYLVVADAYSRAGNPEKALEVLHKIADLDPHNTEVRLKLAEGYLKEGLRSEAVEAFAEAGSRLFDNGKFEKSLESYSRVLELSPHHQAALKGLVSAHVALDTAYEAAEILERAAEQKPDDVELISILLYAYLEAQDAPGAERATTLLMSHDAGNYTRFFDVARLYLGSGEIDSAARVLASITERVLAGREENQLLELVNEVLARDPEQVTALRLLVRIHWWQRDMEKLRAALERLAEAAAADNLAEDERYALTQLVRLAPDETRYVERLRELGGAQEDLVDEPSTFADTNLEEVPTFESFAIVRDESDEVTAGSDQTPAQFTEFEFNSVAPETISDPSASFADLNETIERGEIVSPREVEAGFSHPTEDQKDVDFGGVIVDTSSARNAQPEPSVDGERREAMMRQELESVDFYIAQGYNDIAVDTLDLLERQFGSHPEIDVRRNKLGALGETGPAPPAQQKEFEPAGIIPEPRGAELSGGADLAFAEIEGAGAPAQSASSNSDGSRVSAKSVQQIIDPGLAEIFEEFRVAAEEETTSDNDDHETHYNMGIAYKEMDLLDEAIQEFQSAAGLVKPNDGTPRYLQCCNMLGHCFVQKGVPKAAVKWFKKGLEAPGHGEEEYQALRYDLGWAYEQAGDLDRAIDLLTDVYSVDVSYRGVAEKLQDLQKQKAKRKGKKSKR
jgi:tetratricopeptide (TPR) repeat protein